MKGVGVSSRFGALVDTLHHRRLCSYVIDRLKIPDEYSLAGTVARCEFCGSHIDAVGGFCEYCGRPGGQE